MRTNECLLDLWWLVSLLITLHAFFILSFVCDSTRRRTAKHLQLSRISSPASLSLSQWARSTSVHVCYFSLLAHRLNAYTQQKGFTPFQ
jgi:hypothetical protein